MKDPYIYVKCKDCGNCFKVVRTGADISQIFGCTSKTVFLLECPRCGITMCERISKKEWKKSNEVKPDNV